MTYDDFCNGYGEDPANDIDYDLEQMQYAVFVDGEFEDFFDGHLDQVASNFDRSGYADRLVEIREYYPKFDRILEDVVWNNL